MPLLGEILAGVEIGKGITNIILRYSKSEYQEKISRLSNCLSKLDKHLASLEGYENQLKQYWDDDTAESYHKVIKKEIKAVKNSQEQVGNQIMMWENAIKEMEDTVGQQTAKIDDMTSILNALDIQD